MCRSLLPSPRELVDGHSENHQDSSDQNLIDGIDPNELKTIAKDANDKHPDQRTHDPAAAAKKARPAQHHRSDACEILRLPRVGIADVGARHEQQCCYSIEESSYRINPQQQGRCVDTAET